MGNLVAKTRYDIGVREINRREIVKIIGGINIIVGEIVVGIATTIKRM